MITPDRAGGVQLVTDRQFALPEVHPLMVNDDPIARRAVQIVAEQGCDPMTALERAEHEAGDLLDHIGGAGSI